MMQIYVSSSLRQVTDILKHATMSVRKAEYFILFIIRERYYSMMDKIPFDTKSNAYLAFEKILETCIARETRALASMMELAKAQGEQMKKAVFIKMTNHLDCECCAEEEDAGNTPSETESQ
jgi:hypothetical protein